MPRTELVFVLVVCLVAAPGCLGGGTSPEDGNVSVDAPEPYTDTKVRFVVDGQELGELAVETAETRSERARGLMERESLPEGTGMLFVYDTPAPRGFWMKDTLVPLDIIFVDGDMRVLNVEHASPEPGVPDDELTRYRSDGAAQYVVEAERGYANRTGVSSGDRLVIRR
jgi:uncharacterized membrane protein (UPF0127 family)